jgi:polysaccharide biosynthesis protein PslG
VFPRRPSLKLWILCALLLSAVLAPRPAPAAPERLVPQLDDAPFGLNTHIATRYPDLASMNVPADIVAQSGAGWVREDIHWFRVQPDPATWDWSYTDQAIRELLARNIKIVAVLGHPPGWATPYSGDTPDGFSFYAPEPRQFAAFASAAAQRYGRYIHHWEIWNEPDNPLFWKPTPDPAAYATLLKLASAAIHRADRNAQVLLGGVNPFNTEFLRGVAATGAWDSFEILAIHPYVDPATPEDGNLIAAADGVWTLTTQLGAKPIWVTEIGWASGQSDHDSIGVSDEQIQANNLVRGLLLLWRAGVERIFWYTLKDDPGNPYGLVDLGTGSADYSRLKPAFHAFQTLNHQLAGAEFIALHDPFTRATVLNFETPGGWLRPSQPNGRISSTTATAHGGERATRLDYRFTTQENDYIVFQCAQRVALPGQPYAIGLWVYGDGSGGSVKIWLRDATGETLQFTLGTVGPPGWRLLQVPVGVRVGQGDRLTPDGDGRLDFPVRLDAIVLDDAPDSFMGNGTIYFDDLIAISGPEAYDLELRRGETKLDILWASGSIGATLSSTGARARVIDRDGSRSTTPVTNGKIELSLGPAPIYVVHSR